MTRRNLREQSAVPAPSVSLAVAVAVFTVCLLLALSYIPLFVGASGHHPQVFGFPGATAVTGLAFASMGLLVALRQPWNPLGWVMLAAGLLLQAVDVSQLYAITAYRGSGAGGVLGIVSAWVGSVMWAPGLALLPVGLLLFPDGRLASRRWRIALVTMVVLDAVVAIALATFVSSNLATGPGQIGPDGQIAALSDGATTSTTLGRLFVLSMPLLVITFVIGTWGLAVHTVEARGERRQQMKWFASAAAAGTIGFAAYVIAQLTTNSGSVITHATSGLFVLLLSLLPVATAVAILKYHLYDIDIVISRALVYGSLAVLITGVYVGIAVGFGELVGSGGKPNLGLSILATAIVAVSFQPARERLQHVANRLVYGKRATPYQVLSEFSSQVAGAYAADQVLPQMARLLDEGTGAERSTVWLRSAGSLHAAATWPPAESQELQPSIPMSDGALPELPDATRAAEVRHQGELLGAVSIVKRRGETLTPVEEKLLDDVAQQAGLVLKNVGLTSDLQRRLEELRASRQRLVSAQDQARRKLERNLHDGAQQHLVALKVKLGLAEMLATKDPEKARATITQLKADTDEALEALRDLARGIYPPLLAEKGLGVALESQARKATLPVKVDADGVGRYPQDAEATVYFCVLEALQNVQKYAKATRAVVRLRVQGGTLVAEVEDDGGGFDLRTVRQGAGLTNMHDRLDAISGSLEITSEMAHGTTVRAVVPVNALAAVST